MDLPHGILPAVRKMKDFEKVLETKHDWIVFLETRLSQIKSLVEHSRRADKKILIHFDLIQGLKADEYGVEFLMREVQPDGLISTRGNIINQAKKNNILAIQRMFLLDTLAYEQNLRLSTKFRPDCIEVLPGLMPNIVEEIQKKTNIPIITGGLIRTMEEVGSALGAGAIAISTSHTDLWEF